MLLVENMFMWQILSVLYILLFDRLILNVILKIYLYFNFDLHICTSPDRLILSMIDNFDISEYFFGLSFPLRK